MLLVAGLVLFAVIVGVVGWAALSTYRLTIGARERLAAYLGERLQSDVELADCRVTLFPRPRVTGERLIIRHRGRRDVPPLVSIERFSADTTLRGLLNQPRRAGQVWFEGLRVFVPPGRQRTEGSSSADKRRALQEAPLSPGVIVDQLHTDNAVLEIGTRQPGKPPRRFDIHHLELRDVAIERSMLFDAVLTNPKPPGQIISEGTFGPWVADEPSATPLGGRFTFENADLGVFTGIDGTLSAKGAYSGVLDRIDVHGSTRVPDFELTWAGHEVPLEARYTAVVDGRNGNTTLRNVQARWRGVSLTARGTIEGRPGVKGRTVALDAVMRHVVLEDVLYLAMQGARPLMRGRLDLDTRFVLPPGRRNVIERMQLDGKFAMAQVRFTTLNIQKALAELSRRGRGDLEAEAGESIASDMRGRFTLRNGRLHFSHLTFAVPGATVQLAGDYVIPSEQLAFTGTLQTEAKVSQMTRGWKRLLLKVVDPLFSRRGKGAVIPINVTGSKAKPKFSVDVKRIFKRN